MSFFLSFHFNWYACHRSTNSVVVVVVHFWLVMVFRTQGPLSFFLLINKCKVLLLACWIVTKSSSSFLFFFVRFVCLPVNLSFFWFYGSNIFIYLYYLIKYQCFCCSKWKKNLFFSFCLIIIKMVNSFHQVFVCVCA